MVWTPIFPNLPIQAQRVLNPMKAHLIGLKHAVAAVSVPFDCCLCKEPCGSGGLCNTCSKLLYFNDNFCLRCANPVVAADDLAALDAAENVISKYFEGCEYCRHTEFPWRRAIVPLRYCFPLDLLVIRFKYQEDMVVGRALGQILGEQIASFVKQHPDPPIAMIPIPLEADRMRRRGFNQSQELAQAAAAVCSLPVWSNVLRRQRFAKTDARGRQNIRSRNVRMRSNVSGFSCTGTLDSPVLLIDDVMTTGSTLKGAAETLLQAGAPSVDVAAIGRTLDQYR